MNDPKTKRVLLWILAVVLAAAGVYLLFPVTRSYMKTALAVIGCIPLELLVLSPLLILIYYGEKRKNRSKSGTGPAERKNAQGTAVMAPLKEALAERKEAAAEKAREEHQRAWEECKRAVRERVRREREKRRQAQEELRSARQEQEQTRPQEVRDLQSELEQKCREQNDIMGPFLPPELAGRVPALSYVLIEGCGLPGSAPEGAGPFPKDIRFSEKDGPYVQYEYVGKWRLQKHANKRFSEAVHPFIQSSAPADAGHCAEALSDYIRYSPKVFTVFKDRLEIVYSAQFYGSAYYSESANSVQLYAGTTDSYHDGGGSYGFVWSARGTLGMTPPKELHHEQRPMSRITMPPCKGYWLENGSCYLLEPWDMPGVFEFYIRNTEKSSNDSEENVQQIGVRFD